MPTYHGRNIASVKRENIRLALDVIERYQPLSRTDIAAMTDISPASITRIVNALLRYGLIFESETIATGQRGRKAVRLSMRSDGMYTAGVCVEARQLLVCVIDVSHAVQSFRAVRLPENAPADPEAIALLAKDAVRLMKFGDRISAVGVSVAGTVDPLSGRVTRSDQMHWTDRELGEVFARAFGTRAWIENDVKACLFGERQRRGIPGDEDSAYILVGTGVGVAVHSNGAIVRGVRNEAGEVEHLPFPDGDTLAEHLVEETLITRARAAAPSVSTMADIMDAWALNLRWAVMLMEDFKAHLRFVIDLVNGLFNPKTIILGGSVVQDIAPLIADWVKDGKVSLGDDYDHACMIGAAQLCMRHAIHALIKEGNGGAE